MSDMNLTHFSIWHNAERDCPECGAPASVTVSVHEAEMTSVVCRLIEDPGVSAEIVEKLRGLLAWISEYERITLAYVAVMPGTEDIARAHHRSALQKLGKEICLLLDRPPVLDVEGPWYPTPYDCDHNCNPCDDDE